MLPVYEESKLKWNWEVFFLALLYGIVIMFAVNALID
jgi:hypothetical protein